jgi:hypothetical protein
MTIDLSKHVGKIIIAELIDNYVLKGRVTDGDSHLYPDFPYSVDGWAFNKQGKGLSKASIVRVLCPFEGDGIAQKAPHIDLDDFVGQKVYVKLARGSEHVTNVSGIYNLSEVGQYDKRGIPSSGNEHWRILEIYGEGAYQISTKSTFDTPGDYLVKQAKQLFSQMSEEQIAKLLKSL